MLDHSLKFSAKQSMAASSAAVTQSTNVHSLGDGLYNMSSKYGGAEVANQLGGLVWNLNVSTAINAVTIITAKLMVHSAATSIASGTELASIVLGAAAAAGTRRSLKLPAGFETGTTTPHIGVTYTVSGAKCTAGNINSFLSLEEEKHD